eukprot:3301524-Alexandrium_andersonii.AAC.1
MPVPEPNRHRAISDRVACPPPDTHQNTMTQPIMSGTRKCRTANCFLPPIRVHATVRGPHECQLPCCLRPPVWMPMSREAT